MFAVLEGDKVVGSTSIGADGFPVVRTFETGSWLGRRFQGRGLGTEMRVATLHLGFLGLDALEARHRRLPGQPGVARRDAQAGVRAERRRRCTTGVGSRAHIDRFRMTRQHFLDHVRRDDVEIDGDAAVRELLGIEPVSA